MVDPQRVHEILRHEYKRRVKIRVSTILIVGLVLLIGILLEGRISTNAKNISELQGMVKTQCQDSVPTTSKAQQICDKAQSNQLPGATGPAGSNGQNGRNGSNGADGNPGPTGSTGAAGKSGKAGSQGLTGSSGATGQPGTQGLAGKDGKDGLAGPAGPPGSPGPQGPQGPKGDTGATGQDGRGVSSTQCIGGQWVVSYTDGTTQTTGSCS